MPFVLTVDQRDSRNAADGVDAMVGRLAGTATLLPFRSVTVDRSGQIEALAGLRSLLASALDADADAA